MYKIMDKPLGTTIEENIQTIEECKEIIADMEKSDKRDKIYIPNWYAILPM